MSLDQLRLHLGPAPAWLLFHGSPFAAASRGTVLFWHGFTSTKETGERELSALAGAGFLAVGLDNVGHGERRRPDFDAHFGGSGPTFERPFFAAVRATADETPVVVEALVARGWAQPGRLGLAGISMGGCVAYRAVQLERRVSAAVAILGLPAWPAETEHSPHLRPEAFVPVALLSQVAGADANVPPGAARALHAELRPRYTAAPERERFIEYPGVGHFMPEAEWSEVLRNTTGWFERFLRAPTP
jgi:uncharacterized protein